MRQLSGWTFPELTNHPSNIGWVSPIICFLLGFVCLLLGIARSINKLGGKSNYLLAIFLVLFSLTEVVEFDPIFESSLAYAAIIVDRITIFLYPLPLYIFLFSELRPNIQKWAWPFVAIPTAYSISAWIAYLTVKMPFALSIWLFTDISIICFIAFLALGIFGAATKSSLFLMRLMSAYGCVFGVIILVMTMLGVDFSRQNVFVDGMGLMAAISIGYLIFTSANELLTYRTGMQLQGERNALLLENYQNLETYMSQITQMKHEMRNHLLAMKILSDDEQYERLAGYLEAVQSNYPEHIEPVHCGHRLIQSILGHYSLRAKQMNTDITFDVCRLPPLSISDTDTVSLFMNLLNNALESCEKIQALDRRWIEVTIKCSDPYLYISLKNAMCCAVRHATGRYLTTKEEARYHGHGHSIVKSIAEKYGGFVRFDHSEESFSAEVAICVIAGKTQP